MLMEMKNENEGDIESDGWLYVGDKSDIEWQEAFSNSVNESDKYNMK